MANAPHCQRAALPTRHPSDGRLWRRAAQVVLEARGRCLSESEYEQLADPSYVLSFDDKLLQLKRTAADPVMYIDLREQGNLMRRASPPRRIHPTRLAPVNLQ